MKHMDAGVHMYKQTHIHKFKAHLRLLHLRTHTIRGCTQRDALQDNIFLMEASSKRD